MSRQRTQQIVTRASLMALLQDEAKRPHVIGRALVALFNNQTRDEQSANHTTQDNTIGFSGSDAKSGSITAKYYLKHKTLLPWQVDMWMRDFRGFPRICKYVRQLNAAAAVRQIREERKAQSLEDPDQGE